MLSTPKKILSFIKNDRGAVLIFVGMSLIPIILILGLAVDSSIALQQKRSLQAAVDAAARAGVANGNGVAATITTEAQKTFAVNITSLQNVTGPNVSVNTTNNTVTVTASIVVPTTFMSIGGSTTKTYNATATVPMGNQNIAEVAIVYEVSARFLPNNFHQNICNALITFVNNLPSNVMVSITPIATEFLLESSTTVSNSLFGHLSVTTNDESANPAFYPLSTNYIFNNAAYNSTQNHFYYANGIYATYPTDPGVLTSNPVPSICPGGYTSCAPKMWPTKCPPSTTNISCSQVYTYISNPSYPILPLTANKTMVVNYLNKLKNFKASADGLFPSLISWGWRTIDPLWKDFWLVNSDKATTLRATGEYPKAYDGVQKSMILIFNNSEYWNDFTPNVSAYYVNKCGDATRVVNGLNHWWMSGYGMIPVPTDYISKVDDITCENKWFKTMDKSLGLNLSDATNYKGTVTGTSFKESILKEVSAKFFRICKNIKAKNVDIYLLANGNTGTLSPCCNSSANAFTIGNSATSISTALNSVQSKIVAKIK